MIKKQDDLLKKIEQISQTILEQGKSDYNTEEFKESFFRQASHSPDNLQSMKYIEYGDVKKEYLQNRRTFGLKIREKDILLSDIVYFLENDKIRDLIDKEFSELTCEEVEAAQRILTIIIAGLECQEIGLIK